MNTWRSVVGATVLAGIAAAFLTAGPALTPPGTAMAEERKSPQIVHDVYFTLKDKSPAAVEKLIAACKKYIKSAPGVTAFSVGVVAPELKREVNDRDWDVGLHVVFETQEYHDKYQSEDKNHHAFIAEGKENWEKVRVFDTEAR